MNLLNLLKMLVSAVNGLLWGDLIILNIGGVQIGLSILVVILIPAGIYFTIRTKFLPFRMFPEMVKIALEPKKTEDKESISGLQALLIATASRVGMGNLAGVVAAISFGGAGAIFWMWIVAIVGSASAFIEATLAQLLLGLDSDTFYIYHVAAVMVDNLRRLLLGINLSDKAIMDFDFPGVGFPV